MKNILGKMIFGKDNKTSGFIAFAIVGLIVLGCTCNKQFGDFKEDTPTSSPTTTTSPTTTYSPTTTTSSNTSTSSNSKNPFGDSSKETPKTTSSGDTPSDAELQSLVQ